MRPRKFNFGEEVKPLIGDHYNSQGLTLSQDRHYRYTVLFEDGRTRKYNAEDIIANEAGDYRRRQS